MTLPRSPLALGVLAFGAATYGTSCEVPSQKDFLCGRVTLTVRDDDPSGDVRLRAKLRQDDEEPGTINFAWADDLSEENPNPTWHLATIEGETTGLQTNADGVSYDFVWHSARDLGQGLFENISLRVVGSSECGPWEVEQEDGYTVDNQDAPGEGCTVEVEDVAGPVDGPVAINFTLTHPDSLLSYVSPTWSDDGGETWNPLSLEDGDCDGDGVDDGLANLNTSPEGVPHCITWDSQLDFAADKDVSVRLACGVGYAEDSESATADFTVENDPSPGANEVIITELKPDSGFSVGDYMEIYNRTGHILNLDGVEVARWRSGSNPSRDDPNKTFTLSDPSGTLLIYPGEYLLLSGSEDEAETGCLEPDIVWEPTFSLADNSQILLRTETVTIAQFKFLDDGGWDFSESVSMGLNPSALDSEDWSDFSNWCEQTSIIPECGTEVEDDLEPGTPGEENDRCR